MLQADSVRDIGLKPILHVLIVVENGDREAWRSSSEIQGMFLLVAQQLEVLWGNGVDRGIQRAKEIWNTIERSSDCSGGWQWLRSCGKKTSSSGTLPQIGNCLSKKQLPISGNISELLVYCADHATTRGATVKGSGQAYSVCDTGIETTFQEILIVAESGGGGGEKILAMSPNRPRL